MPVTAPTPSDLLTVGGLAIITAIIVEVILRAWQPTGATKDRFGPLLAIGTAVVLAVVASVVTGNDLFAGILLGVVVGGTSMGVHDVTDSVTDTSVNP